VAELGWASWTSLGGALSTAPEVAVTPARDSHGAKAMLHVFTRANDGTIHTRSRQSEFCNASWSAWRQIPAVPTRAAAVRALGGVAPPVNVGDTRIFVC
jgi:hypothetical protein